MKKCSKCKLLKPISEFYTTYKYIKYLCKVCDKRAVANRYRKKHNLEFDKDHRIKKFRSIKYE